MKAQEIWTAYEQSPMYAKEVTQRRKDDVKKIWLEFAAYAGNIDCTEITSNLVADWLEIRCKECAPKTYNEYLRIVRQVINGILSKTGLLVNPALEVPVKHKQSISRKPYTKQEIQKIIDAVETGRIRIPYRYKTHGKEFLDMRPYDIPHAEEVKISILLGAYCGMRLGDAVSVTASQYEDGFLTYTPHKTQSTSGVSVTVPVIHPALRDVLEHCRGALTPNLRDMHKRQASDLCRLYNRIFAACGFDVQQKCKGRRNATIGGFHALRHSYVTWSAEAGIPIDIVAECVGHTSTLTTQIYNHVNQQRKAKEMMRLMAM